MRCDAQLLVYNDKDRVLSVLSPASINPVIEAERKPGAGERHSGWIKKKLTTITRNKVLYRFLAPHIGST